MTLYISYEETAKLFSEVVIPLSIPTSSAYIFTDIQYSQFLKTLAILMGVQCICHYGFSIYFPNNNNVERLFMCVFAICTSSLNCLSGSFAILKIRVSSYLQYFEDYLYILIPLSAIFFVRVSPNLWLVFLSFSQCLLKSSCFSFR